MKKHLKDYADYLIKWIKEKVQEAHADGVVLGLSGGIDSSLAAILAKKACGEKHHVLIMPISKNTSDFKYANELVKKHKINYSIVNMKKNYTNFLKSLNASKTATDLAKINILPRLRMTALYFYAKENNYLVLGTSNFCEWYTGYFTKYGDGAADLYPLVNLLKSEIKHLSQYFNISDQIINRDATAGLLPNQTDESELGFSYSELEKFLLDQTVVSSIAKKINLLHKISAHKRISLIFPKKIIR